jgi:phage terminase small subunit
MIDKAIDGDVGLAEEMIGEGKANPFGFDAPEFTSEQLRTAVNESSAHKTRDGKVWGVKGESKGRLTGKQRLFCNLIVTQSLSATEAYRRAYNVTSDRMATSSVDANRLMKNPKVKDLLESALARTEDNVINDAQMTRRHIMAELLEHSRSMKSESSKLKALELMGKAVGMFVDKVEQTIEQVSPEQLKDELSKHLALLDQATKH